MSESNNNETILKVLDRIDTKVSETRDRVIALEAKDALGKVEKVDGKVEKVETRLGKLENRVSKSETRVTIISSAIALAITTIIGLLSGFFKNFFTGS